MALLGSEARAIFRSMISSKSILLSVVVLTASHGLGLADEAEKKRFEPTRPWSAAVGSDRKAAVKRFEPSRPQRVFGYKPSARVSRESASNRFAPTRPKNSISYDGRLKSVTPRVSGVSSNLVHHTRPRAMSSKRKYDGFESAYRTYRKTRQLKKRLPGEGRAALKPFRATLKFSKKAASKLTFGWLPLF